MDIIIQCSSLKKLDKKALTIEISVDNLASLLKNKCNYENMMKIGERKNNEKKRLF